MKKYSTLLLPLLTTSLLSACATSAPPNVAQRPTVIKQQDIARIAQQGQARALDARAQQIDGSEVLAGEAPIELINASQAKAVRRHTH